MRRTLDERRAARAAGLDRFGNTLPRTAGTSPRARRQATVQAEAVDLTNARPGKPTTHGGTHGEPGRADACGRTDVSPRATPRAADLPPHARLSRAAVRKVASCPTCWAGDGEMCTDSHGQERVANHFARVEQALELIFGTSPAPAGDSRQGPRVGDAVKGGDVSPRAQRAALDGSDQVGHDGAASAGTNADSR
jgi:hypothetical protein